MATTLDQVILERTANESDLTIYIMRQVAARLDLHDPELFDALYDTVIFYTGSWPEEQGWGSSDTSAVVRSFQKSYQTQHTPQ